jgi:uncharacterized protein YukJ
MVPNYGVLKGTVAGHLRDADDDHYQILVHAGKTVYRIACNVKSSAPKSPSTLLFQSRTSLPDALTAQLKALAVGFTKLPSKPGGVAMDYVRGGLVTPKAMKPVPPDAPGVDNDLKDKLEAAAVKAMAQEGSVIYAFGAKWGPEKKPDQYFRFVPGNGIHDIHMNQGNSGKYKKDNGVYQDGALFISFPENKWQVFFFAFQSQSFKTDNRGNPLPAGKGNAAAVESAKTGKKAKSPTLRKQKPT